MKKEHRVLLFLQVVFGSPTFRPCSIKAKRLIADTFVCFVSFFPVFPPLFLPSFTKTHVHYLPLPPLLIPSPFSFLDSSSSSPFLPSSQLVARSSFIPCSSHKQSYKKSCFLGFPLPSFSSFLFFYPSTRSPHTPRD